jgi:hypothetical protein
LDLSLGWNFWNQLLAESITTHNGIISGTNQASYPERTQQARGVLKRSSHSIRTNWIRYPNQQLSVEPDAGDDTSISERNKIIRNQTRSRSAKLCHPSIARLDGTENVSGTVRVLIIQNQARSPTAHINLLQISEFDHAELELPIQRSTSKPRREYGA